MINEVEQLPINSRVKRILCTNGFDVSVRSVVLELRPHNDVMVFRSYNTVTGEPLKFEVVGVNKVKFQDTYGNVWDDQVLAISDDMAYPIYSKQAKHSLTKMIARANITGGVASLLGMLGVAVWLMFNIYIALPVFALCLLGLRYWHYEAKTVNATLRTWGTYIGVSGT